MKYKVGIYIRKSTDSEDSQALSLQKQRDVCNELLRGIEDYEIVKVWEESISAKQAGQRPGFKEMLKMAEKGQIDCIVVWKLSRIARNSLDQAYIETYLQEGKIKLILSQDGVFRPEDNILLMRIYFSIATQYSRDLGKDASQGMLTKVKGGQPVKIPRGYDFDKHKNAIPNADAPAIKEIFRLKREGVSLSDIAQKVHDTHGLSYRDKPLASSSIHNIISNTLYYGAITYMGEIYEGTYKPLVSYRDWKESNTTHGAKREKNPGVDFARNLVFNYETGNALCPYLSKGCLYFRSTERDGPNIHISFSQIEEYFTKNIYKYILPEQYKQIILEGYRDFCMNKFEDSKNSKESIMNEMSKIDKKRASLLDMRMNEELDTDEYKKLKNDLTNRYLEYQERLNDLNELDEDISTKGLECFELISNLEQVWNNANIITKTRIIRMICFELFVDTKKALHLAERELFEEVRNMVDCGWLSRLENLRKTPLLALYAAMAYTVKRGDNSFIFAALGKEISTNCSSNI